MQCQKIKVTHEVMTNSPLRKSGQRVITPTKKSSQRNSIFLTHKSYGYSEKCMRACVIWEKREGLAKTVMGRSGHASVFFDPLPLFELEIKDTTDTIKGPTI